MDTNQLTQACIELLDMGAYDAVKKTLAHFRPDNVTHAEDYAAWEATMRDVLFHTMKLEQDGKAPKGDREALAEFSNDHLTTIINARKEKPSKVIRERLFLGEADFTFTAAFIKKVREQVPEIGKHIRSTEYLPFETLQEIYGDAGYENVAYAQEAGAKLKGGVDATALSSYPFLKDRYHRIHFNCPHDRSNYEDPDRPLPNMLKGFFEEAAKKQQLYDRVHIALPKHDSETTDQFRQAHVYSLYDAAAHSGYMLVKKRRFGSERYPGYRHRVTGMAASAVVAQSSREYIFEKTHYSYEDIVRITPPRRYYAAQFNVIRYALPNLDTDNESSDYLTDNEDEATKTSKRRPK